MNFIARRSKSLIMRRPPTRNKLVFSRSTHYGSQGHTLRIDTSNICGPLYLEIITKWQEYAEIEQNTGGLYSFEAISTEENTKLLRVIVNDVVYDTLAPLQRHKLPTIIIPELFNIYVVGKELDVGLKNKMMGDLSISTCGASVVIDKVKGSKIYIDAKEADVKVTKVVEGGLRVQCNKLDAKMINGASIDLDVNDTLSCDAMYGNRAEITCNEHVQLGLFKGNLKLQILRGSATVNGVDGSLQIEANNGHVEAQINNLHARESSSDSNEVLYSSIIQAQSVVCLMDPEIQANLKCVTELDTDDNIEIDSDAFQLYTIGEDQKSIAGTFSGVSTAVKRPNFGKYGSADSGKVHLRGSEESRMATQLPALNVESSGKIFIKTMSWIEVIRRRHGFVDKNGTI